MKFLNGGISGIYFNSDKTKNEKLYELDIDDIINIFNQIGRDYPVSSTMILDSKTGEYTVYHDDAAEIVGSLLEFYFNLKKLTLLAITTHNKQDNRLEEIQEQLARFREIKSPEIRSFCDFLLAYAKGKKAEEMKNDIDDSDWEIFEKIRKDFQ